MTLRSVFRLKVQRISKSCLFELTWGRGQQLSATLDYPEALTTVYREWQRSYLSFYKSKLRGRVEATGSIAPLAVDWHAKLVEAQAKLLFEFHRWLRSSELYDIRAAISRAARDLAGQVAAEPSHYYIDIFLTCNPIELERFPWEAWEIGTEFATTGTIRIARTPVNIRAETTDTNKQGRGRTRILAILGDDTGLNFQADRQAVRSLSRFAEVEFVGWQLGKTSTEVKDQICKAISDERGWDLLFFAGHSNETAITGGELAIAPGVSMSISEIAPQLTVAKARGLKFAIFNSCSGLSIAASLIDLGLSQVAVMREPVHNQVAQAFLVRFLQVLAEYKDVHDALMAACQHLEKNLNYPSAYLIPTLFSHPDAVLFRIEPSGVRQRLKQWLPTRREAIALGTFLVLGLSPTVQDFLLEHRVLVQAIYRDVTDQVPPPAPPPVLLVQIDQPSLLRAGINEPNPIDRSYLASLIDKISALNAIVGIDYLLDYQQPGKDQTLSQSVHTAVDQKDNWFVFAAIQDAAEKEVGVAPETGIANRNWSLQGYTNGLPHYVSLLPAQTDCYRTCPFAYLLAMVHALNQGSAPAMPQPRLQSQTDFRTQVFDYINRNRNDDTIAFLQQARLHPITSFSEKFGQLWLQPINDFSIPPDSIYDRIAAWQLLDSSSDREAEPHRIEPQVALIAAGGYSEAGVTKPGADNFPVPIAVAYWRERLGAVSSSGHYTDYPPVFTGAEAHAYMIQHLLTQRLVVPVPDLWMIGVAVLLGKGTTLVLMKHHHQRQRWAIGLSLATAVYSLAGLQIYVSVAVLLPWFLPSAAFWIYVLPALRRKSYA